MKKWEKRIQRIVKRRAKHLYLFSKDGSVEDDSVSMVIFSSAAEFLKSFNSGNIIIGVNEILQLLSESFLEEGITGTISGWNVSFKDLDMTVISFQGNRLILSLSWYPDHSFCVSKINASKVKSIPKAFVEIRAAVMDLLTPERKASELSKRAAALLKKHIKQEEHRKKVEFNKAFSETKAILGQAKGKDYADIRAAEMVARITFEGMMATSTFDRPYAEGEFETAAWSLYEMSYRKIEYDTNQEIRRHLYHGSDYSETHRKFVDAASPFLARLAYPSAESIWEEILKGVQYAYRQYCLQYDAITAFESEMEKPDPLLDALVQRGWSLEVRKGTYYQAEHAVLCMKIVDGQIVSFATRSRFDYDYTLIQARAVIPFLDVLSSYCDSFQVVESLSTISKKPVQRQDPLADRFKSLMESTDSGHDIGVLLTPRLLYLWYRSSEKQIFCAKIRTDFNEEDAKPILDAFLRFVEEDASYRENNHYEYCRMSFGIKPNKLLTEKTKLVTPFWKPTEE